MPKLAAEGLPWIWRPAFFGAFPAVDLALLEQGYHVAYFELDNEFANPTSLKAGDEFYKYMVKFYSLSPGLYSKASAGEVCMPSTGP